jgi:hypothetical protein
MVPAAVKHLEDIKRARQPNVTSHLDSLHAHTLTRSHARKRHPPPFRKFRGPSVLALVLSAVSYTDDAAGVTSRHHQHQQDFFPRAIGADQVLAAFPLPIYYIICPHRHAPSLKLRACRAFGSHIGPSSKHTLFHSRQLLVPQASNPTSREIHTHNALALRGPYTRSRCSYPQWRGWSSSRSTARLVAPRQTDLFFS